uniref:Uncharacterized protein n=1 Tax=Heterorhabditis bacteriophora TaxID=37862 RepID=A0A1I7WFS6_HETBA
MQLNATTKEDRTLMPLLLMISSTQPLLRQFVRSYLRFLTLLQIFMYSQNLRFYINKHFIFIIVLLRLEPFSWKLAHVDSTLPIFYTVNYVCIYVSNPGIFQPEISTWLEDNDVAEVNKSLLMKVVVVSMTQSRFFFTYLEPVQMFIVYRFHFLDLILLIYYLSYYNAYIITNVFSKHSISTLLRIISLTNVNAEETKLSSNLLKTIEELVTVKQLLKKRVSKSASSCNIPNVKNIWNLFCIVDFSGCKMELLDIFIRLQF